MDRIDIVLPLDESTRRMILLAQHKKHDYSNKTLISSNPRAAKVQNALKQLLPERFTVATSIIMERHRDIPGLPLDKSRHYTPYGVYVNGSMLNGQGVTGRYDLTGIMTERRNTIRVTWHYVVPHMVPKDQRSAQDDILLYPYECLAAATPDLDDYDDEETGMNKAIMNAWKQAARENLTPSAWDAMGTVKLAMEREMSVHNVKKTFKDYLKLLNERRTTEIAAKTAILDLEGLLTGWTELYGIMSGLELGICNAYIATLSEGLSTTLWTRTAAIGGLTEGTVIYESLGILAGIVTQTALIVMAACIISSLTSQETEV